MKKRGTEEVRRVLGEYIQQLKSGLLPRMQQDQPTSNDEELGFK